MQTLSELQWHAVPETEKQNAENAGIFPGWHCAQWVALRQQEYERLTRLAGEWSAEKSIQIMNELDALPIERGGRA